MKVKILSTICLLLQILLSIALFNFNSSPKSLSKIIEKDLLPLISQTNKGLNYCFCLTGFLIIRFQSVGIHDKFPTFSNFSQKNANFPQSSTFQVKSCQLCSELSRTRNPTQGYRININHKIYSKI